MPRTSGLSLSHLAVPRHVQPTLHTVRWVLNRPDKGLVTNIGLTQRPYWTRIGGYAEDRARPKLSQKPAFRRPQIPTLELYGVTPLHFEE
jgi:hypothetical protein